MLIRHAFFDFALSVGVLAGAMVFTSFGALLVATVGFTVLTETGETTALTTAVAMPAVASIADGEGSAAVGESASPLIERDFAEIRHACAQAGLDNGRFSVAA